MSTSRPLGPEEEGDRRHPEHSSKQIQPERHMRTGGPGQAGLLRTGAQSRLRPREKAGLGAPPASGLCACAWSLTCQVGVMDRKEGEEVAWQEEERVGRTEGRLPARLWASPLPGPGHSCGPPLGPWVETLGWDPEEGGPSAALGAQQRTGLLPALWVSRAPLVLFTQEGCNLC